MTYELLYGALGLGICACVRTIPTVNFELLLRVL